MGAAVPIIGLGLSAVGTVAGIAQQSAQRRAQEDALTAQQMEAKDRLRLGQAHFESTQLYARQMRDRELTLLDAEKQFQLEQQKAVEVEQQAQVGAMELQGKNMKAQAEQSAASIITAANQEAAGLYSQNRDELVKYAQMLSQSSEGQALLQAAFAGNTGGKANPNSGSQLALDDARIADIIDAFQATMQNVGTRRTSAEKGTEYADKIAQYQKDVGNLGADYIQSTAGRQKQMYTTGNDYQRQLLDLQHQRNRKATEAEYSAAAASANMAQLSNVISERANLASIEAQKRAVGGGGFLSFVQGASGLLSQAAPLFARPTTQQIQYSAPSTPSWQSQSNQNVNYQGVQNTFGSGSLGW